MEIKKCCGECRYHYHEDIDDGWVCVNDASECVTDWTEYDYCCDEWESRDKT